MGGDWSAKSARGGGNREEAYLREGKGEVLPDTASRRGPAATADGLDRWRDFFRGAGAGICDVIENAVLVAAADAPRELLYRRDRIAERLFTVHRRDVAAAPPPSLDSVAASATPFEEDKGSVRRVAEDCKVDSSSNDDDDSDSDSDDGRLRRAAASNYGHNYHDDEDEHGADEEQDEEQDHEAEELEALTNEIDEESQVVGEVLRIKDILSHKEDHVCPLVYACSTAKLSHLLETI
jgi:hypothetical protein